MKKRSTPASSSKGRHRYISLGWDGIGPNAASTSPNRSAVALKKRCKDATLMGSLQTLNKTIAPPLNAWWQYLVNLNYRASLAASRWANDGFGGPTKVPPSLGQKLRCGAALLKAKLGTKGFLAAAGALPTLAGLNKLIVGRVGKKSRTKRVIAPGGWPPTDASCSTWCVGMGPIGAKKSAEPAMSNCTLWRDTQPVRQGGALNGSGQTALEKVYKRDSTFECHQDSPVWAASAAAGLGGTSPSLRAAGWIA